MIGIAAILYLPEHVATIAGRAAYYWHGTVDSSAMTKSWANRAGTTVSVIRRPSVPLETVGVEL
jgi:hypothetical protein